MEHSKLSRALELGHWEMTRALELGRSETADRTLELHFAKIKKGDIFILRKPLLVAPTYTLAVMKQDILNSPNFDEFK